MPERSSAAGGCGAKRPDTTVSQAPGTSAFTPKLITVLREGYGTAAFRADLLAGLTVAIVALPLSMAIAIASGVGPERGLFTAIIGGFLVSALGGSRFQIGGPAGAFIVLVAACVADIGVPGLLLATALSGVILMALGLLRLGPYIRFIPYPVTVGFTAGIAVIIFASQIKELLGLSLTAAEPSDIWHKLPALWSARATINPSAALLALGCVVMILGIRRLRPHWPGMLIAVAALTLLATVFRLPVETIGTRFGALPRFLPAPELPSVDMPALRAALPYAVSFALLGAIESLLSALVADGMSGRRHRSSAELVAQGIANIGSSLMGGFCVTGTIARTATNVRAGAHGPMSGMLHAVFLALFMLAAAPLAAHIPLAVLAGVLAVVSWNMIERHAVVELLASRSGDAVVLLATFLLVVFRDLTEGIVVGFALGGLLFISRMSASAAVEAGLDNADHEIELPTEETDMVVYRLRGAFFFGAAATLDSVLDRIAERPRAFVVDLSLVPYIDSTGAQSLASLGRKMSRRGGRLYLAGMLPDVGRVFAAHQGTGRDVVICSTLEQALAQARSDLGRSEG